MARLERKSSPEAGNLAQQIEELGRLRVSVGWFPSARYPDGVPVAQAMASNEFGVPQLGIPPRPFMRLTAAEQRDSWANIAQALGARVLAGKMSADQLAQALGMQAVGDIQRTISKLTEPALSERTLAARRKRGNNSVKPLVDTRVAFNALTYTVGEA